MGMYGADPPPPDPRIGEAAKESAQIGRDFLTFMQDQAQVTNNWANQDRARYINTFQPLEDKFVQKAMTYDTPERKAQAASEAVADVRQQTAMVADQTRRQQTAMGVRPDSGRSIETARKMGTVNGLAAAGAGNMARRSVEARGDQLTGEAINLGRGLAVNPATSMSISNGATSSGFQGAMGGIGQEASLLNQDYSNRMGAWGAKQDQIDGTLGALGNVAGLGFSIFSSKELKENKSKPASPLKAVEKMPVEEWDYKEGVADGGRHIGPYAEDFQAATGKGDGTSIPVVDAIGVTMGAVQELSKKVDALAKPKSRSIKR